MLLEETALPPNAVRTIRLSTPSFLDAVLTRDGTPIYSFLTRKSTTKLCRYNLGKTSDSCPPLVEVATVYWSECETPSPSSPAGVSFLKPLWSRAIKRALKQDCTTLVEVDGRSMQVDDLLRLSAMGGSRKYSVDGKQFRWKLLDGIWQCFYSGNMIAVFEPRITTVGARIRILPNDLSMTRRVMDMLLLTCMLVVTHPGDWSRRLQSSPSKPSPRPRHTIPVPEQVSESPKRSEVYPRRAFSQDESRSDPQPPSPTMPLHRHKRFASAGVNCVSQPILPPLVIPSTNVSRNWAPVTAPVVPSSLDRSLRKAASSGSLSATFGDLSLVPPSHRPPGRALTILSRSQDATSSTPELNLSPSLQRSSSSASSANRRGSRLRPTLSNLRVLPPLLDTQDSSYQLSPDGSEFTASPSGGEASRIWERPNAYPIPYTAISPSGSSSEPQLSPPPYTRRDPTTSRPPPETNGGPKGGPSNWWNARGRTAPRTAPDSQRRFVVVS